MNTTRHEHHDARETLILGGTGKTGRRVAERLKAGGWPVRIGSRASQPSFDWTDQSTWDGALENVRAAYITYYPDLAVPGAADAIGAFARMAVAKGVKRLVLLSGRGEPEAQRAEKMLMASGADWTILRSSWFCQNFSESFMLDLVLEGTIALPVGNVGEPFIDTDDIADTAVAALTDESHAGQLYELTGPRLLTFADVAYEIRKASGRDVQFVSIPADAFRSALTDQGVPPDIIALMLDLFTQVLDGRNAHLTDGVRRALGREPRDFAVYARNAASAWQ
ncbi:MAG: NAD(P)H-binding protein [Phyllobacterium sp.]